MEPIDPMAGPPVLAGLIAYLGPGLSGGVLAIILGFFLSIFLALAAIFWYPLKRLFRGRSKATDDENS